MSRMAHYVFAHLNLSKNPGDADHSSVLLSPRNTPWHICPVWQASIASLTTKKINKYIGQII